MLSRAIAGVTCACLLWLAPACSEDRASKSPVREQWCPDAAERLGSRVCEHEIPEATLWQEMTFPAAAVDQARTTTYLARARDDVEVPTLFVDATAFDAPEQSLHFKFLTGSVPELELMPYEQYLEKTTDPERRDWFAGNVTEFIRPGADSIFGFTVWDEGPMPASTITCEQFRSVYADLNGRFGVGTLAVVPAHGLQRETLADCDVPVFDPSTSLDYEVYTQAKRCGRVRHYTLTELAQAEAQAEFGWQDVLITDEAPLDIQTIIAGIVTGTRQGELSHLNVRSASRGTPNCYVKDAYALLAEWEGELVELECGPTGATVRAITPDEEATCNQGLRPSPVSVVPADLDATELMPLLDLPTATPAERLAGVARYGSKGTNLAVLYQRIPSELQLQGFLVPAHYHHAFMVDNAWAVDFGAGVETVSFEQTVSRWLGDATFTTDGAVRRERLAALQQAMRAAPCDPALVADLGAAVVAMFGGQDVMVRFRSSSNAEDAIEFNGAGLYDSTSVCFADETDADALGPSACDADQPNERDVCRGLTRVWASLWNMKAVEERSWYGIDHTEVAMGILVDTRTKGELANIVAFSGNPLVRGDRRYLINAQLGELDVVAALPGVWPEKALLTLDAGQVVEIERARGSTELPEGEWVLDDARLRDLGESLAQIVEVFPVDADLPPTARTMLDTEWKVRADGQLLIKQVRPFIE